MDYSHLFQRQHLAKCIWILWMFSVSLSRASTPEATIKCSPVEDFRKHLKVVTCQIENKGESPFYLLLDDFVLEGPATSGSDYLYMPLGGLRYENVLHYYQKEFGELFHPRVTVDLKKLARLALLDKRSSREITINWLIVEGENPRRGKWKARISLLYLTRANVNELLRQGSLPPVCRRILSTAVDAAGHSSIYSLRAYRPVGRREFLNDGCHDVISERFDHLFSNRFEVNLD
jgi:hypothetical protein